MNSMKIVFIDQTKKRNVQHRKNINEEDEKKVSSRKKAPREGIINIQ